MSQRPTYLASTSITDDDHDQPTDQEPTAEPSSTDPTPITGSLREAYDAQDTPELRRAALHYARLRAIVVRRAGGRIDDSYASELVHDALVDTWTGDVTWNPDRVSLLDHVRGLVKTRSWRHVTGASRVPHISLDGADGHVARKADEALYHATQGSVTPMVLAALSIKVVRELKRLAHGDTTATAILGCWTEGLIDRDEVIAATGLDDRAYKAARARLTYLVRSLPAATRDETLAALRSN